MYALCGVVGVDAYVFVGEIDGPEFAIAVAEMKIDCDGELRLVQISMCGNLIKLRRASSVAANGQLAKPDVDAIGIHIGARVANGRHQASPIWIVSGPRRLDER